MNTGQVDIKVSLCLLQIVYISILHVMGVAILFPLQYVQVVSIKLSADFILVYFTAGISDYSWTRRDGCPQ